MIHFVICTKDGRIDQAGIYDEELLHTLDIPEGGALVVNQSMPAGDFFYFSKGAFHAIPEKPAGHYSFDYSKKAWVDPRTPETEWPLVQAERNRLLQYTDWTQLPDVPVATKEAWATYRQALRDITEQPDPFNIVWPTPPVT